jgi:beta-lactamase superfamily II metal-dependent hydrolase
MITNSFVEMVFWDVQHGHATYIKSPNNKHIVVDLGIGSYDDNNTLFSPLTHIKEVYHVNRLDYVIITHPHLDHFDDILNYDKLDPLVFCRPKQFTDEEILHEEVRERDRPKFEKYLEINKRYSAPISDNDYRAIKAENYGGMDIKVFHPFQCSRNNFNNHSIVTVFSYADIKVVVPGDNEDDSLEELLKDNAFVTAVKGADILLAPHHGRSAGFYDCFINLVNPRLTIVSDGSIVDTSANHRYSAKSRGWDVWRNGVATERKCLTTNSDGEVFVRFGFNADGGRILQVSLK